MDLKNDIHILLFKNTIKLENCLLQVECKHDPERNISESKFSNIAAILTVNILKNRKIAQSRKLAPDRRTASDKFPGGPVVFVNSPDRRLRELIN
jgi:hypothetical protein